MLYFNIDNGYLEGLVRGFRNGILKQTDYLNLVQCETLDGESYTLCLVVSTCVSLYASFIFVLKCHSLNSYISYKVLL